jgi:hypothetical protein
MFMYQADLYCDACGRRLVSRLEAAGEGAATRESWELEDSDRWPTFVGYEHEADSPTFCGSGSECLEAIDLTRYGFAYEVGAGPAVSRFIGANLTDTLTEYGRGDLRVETLGSRDSAYGRAMQRLYWDLFEADLRDDTDLYYAARAAGAEHGRAAASWYFNGNTSVETFSRVLRGIDEGDPAVLDTFPASPLSGEWADDPTPASVLESLELEPDDPRADEAIDNYEDAFYEAVHHAIEAAARAGAEGGR